VQWFGTLLAKLPALPSLKKRALKGSFNSLEMLIYGVCRAGVSFCRCQFSLFKLVDSDDDLRQAFDEKFKK
jgi:hypothetical protein